MPFNGNGTFNRVYDWEIDKINGVKIRADRMETEMDGMAIGLSTCVTRDGQSPATANLPMGGFNHTGVSDGTARNHYASVGQVQDKFDQLYYYICLLSHSNKHFSPLNLVVELDKLCYQIM